MSLALEDQASSPCAGDCRTRRIGPVLAFSMFRALNFAISRKSSAKRRLQKKLGFTGKAAIHPTNIAVINRFFTPSAGELEEAQGYRRDVSPSEGRSRDVEGKLVEEPIAKRMLRLLETHGEVPAA